MITTVIGTCDICRKENAEVSPLMPGMFSIETFVCEECRTGECAAKDEEAA